MMMMMSPPVTCDDEPTVAVRAGGPGLPPGDSGKRRSLEKVSANLNINFQLFSLVNGFGQNALTLSLEVYLLALHAHAVIDIIRRVHLWYFSSLSLLRSQSHSEVSPQLDSGLLRARAEQPEPEPEQPSE